MASTYLESRAEHMAELEKEIMAKKTLTVIDYLTVPAAILAKHKDFTQHALRVVEALAKMTTTQIEQIQLIPKGRKS